MTEVLLPYKCSILFICLYVCLSVYLFISLWVFSSKFSHVKRLAYLNRNRCRCI